MAVIFRNGQVYSGNDIATNLTPGIVKPDGTTIVIDGEGTISTNLPVDSELSANSTNPV